MSLANNPKKFWNFVKNRKQSKNIPAAMSLNNKIAQDGLNISNLFTKYFSSSYSNVYPSTKNVRVTNTNSVDLCDLSINIQEVFSALENYNCSTGPDGIPEIILRQCKFALTLPLHFLFSLALSSAVLVII